MWIKERASQKRRQLQMSKQELLSNSNNRTYDKRTAQKQPKLQSFPSSSLAFLCFQNQHIKQSAQFGAYETEEFELPTPMIRITLDDLLEIRKQRTFEGSEEPESEPQERTMTVSKLSVGLGTIETGIKVFEDIYVKVQRAETTRQRITTMFAWYWEI